MRAAASSSLSTVEINVVWGCRLLRLLVPCVLLGLFVVSTVVVTRTSAPEPRKLPKPDVQQFTCQYAFHCRGANGSQMAEELYKVRLRPFVLRFIFLFVCLYAVRGLPRRPAKSHAPRNNEASRVGIGMRVSLRDE